MLNCHDPNHTLRKGAVFAVYNPIDCQIVGLARTDEPVAGKAVHLVIVGDVTLWGGSCPLTMV